MNNSECDDFNTNFVNDKVMEKNHQEALRLNWLYLTKNLLVCEVLDYMIQWFIFNDDLKEQVLSKPTKVDKAQEFLFLLSRRGPQAFVSFLKALEHTGQTFIAEKLMQTVAIVNV